MPGARSGAPGARRPCFEALNLVGETGLGRFILTASHGENLGDSYDVVHPELRQGMTRREWLTGNMPVVYYPAKAIETATFKVDESSCSCLQRWLRSRYSCRPRCS